MTTLIEDIRASLVSVIAMIDGAPAPDPAPAPVGAYVTIPAAYQLFGPVQINGAMQQSPGSTAYTFQGNALTASTKMLYMGGNVADIENARAVVVWSPGSAGNEIEIVAFDDGPTNMQQIGVIPGQNVTTPVASGVILTDALRAVINTARANGQLGKQIGFRIRGTVSYTLYEMRLEVQWKIPLAAQ